MTNEINPIEGVLQNLGGAFPGFEIIILTTFLVAVLYSIVHAVIFVYHWKKYDITGTVFATKTYVTYLSGVAFFLVVMLFSLIALMT